MQEILAGIGKMVPSSLLGWALRNRRRLDLLVLNWPENEMVERDGRVNLVRVVRVFVKLAAYHCLSRRVVLVRHNAWPHHTNTRDTRLAKRLVDLYERLCSGSWVHSGHLATESRNYVPHPLYTAEGSAALLPPTLPSSYFVVFGRILPYKQIDKFLLLLPSHIHVVVLGAPSDAAYLRKLHDLGGDNITFITEYVSDSVASLIVRRACATVICHADQDMIVSGSAIFSLSFGVPILTIKTRFTQWFCHHVNARLVHTADDLQALVDRMRVFAPAHMAADVAVVQAHHADAAIRASIVASLRKLGLRL